jgi:flagellar biosynthesis protein FlhB
MREPKPFEATPSRLARARREGDVPRSTELCSACAFVGAALALVGAAPVAVRAAAAALGPARLGAPDPRPYAIVACCALAPALGAGALSVLAAVTVSGGLAVRPLRFNTATLDVVAGVRRMLSGRALLTAVRGVLGAAVAACVVTPAALHVLGLHEASGGFERFVAPVTHAALTMIVGGGAAGVAFGIGDALVERFAWRRRLRMTFDEMKRDLKQTEGDPHLRQRRRSQHLAVLRGSLARLPEASFVVANPLHVAVALEYRPPEVAVPRVLIRAVDAGARLVKARARALGIAVVEDVGLARTLLATTRVDEPIPRACYLAVARIVAMLLAAKPEG